MSKRNNKEITVIHLLRSVQLPEEVLDSVKEAFKESKCPWKICVDYPPIPIKTSTVSRHQLYEHCKQLRNTKGLGDDELIVFLSSIPDSEEWLSAFDLEHNAFVNCAALPNFFRDYPQKYLIMFGIISSLLQTRMKLDLSSQNKHLHEPSIGCMNDFCDNVTEVLLKVKTADICSACLGKLLEEKVDILLIDQAIQGFEYIRKSLLELREIAKLGGDIIYEHSRLKIPNLDKEFSFGPQQTAFYLFFLKRPEGVTHKTLVEERDKIKKLLEPEYDRIKNTSENDYPKNLDSMALEYEISAFEKIVFQLRSKINRKIEQTVGKMAARNFIIDGKRLEPYKIKAKLITPKSN